MKKYFKIILGIFLITTPIIASALPYLPYQGGTGASTTPTVNQVFQANASGTYSVINPSAFQIASGTNQELQFDNSGVLGATTLYYSSSSNMFSIGSTSPIATFNIERPTLGRGTITISSTSNFVNGTGTFFLNDIAGQDTITATTSAGSETRKVVTVISNTQVFVSSDFSGSATNAPYNFAPKDPLTVLNAGYIGINNNSPAYPLEVNGNLDIDNGSYYINGTAMIIASTSLSNFFFGDAGENNATGGENTAAGFQSLHSINTGALNAAFGYDALGDLTTGTNNVGIGYEAGELLSSGGQNIFIGSQAGTSISTGTANVAIGNSALDAETTGSGEIGIGNQSLYWNATGTNNVAIGNNAMENSFSNFATVTNNVAIGNNALNNLENTGSVGIGAFAGYYATSTSNELFINNQDRSTYAGDQNKSLIYGIFNSATSSQSVTINGSLSAFAPTFYGTSTTNGLVIKNLSNTLIGVDASGNIVATTTSAGSGVTNGYASSTFPSFVYATSTYIPYTGANANVNLGSNTLTLTGQFTANFASTTALSDSGNLYVTGTSTLASTTIPVGFQTIPSLSFAGFPGTGISHTLGDVFNFDVASANVLSLTQFQTEVLVAGTASVPALSIGTNSNTGLYTPSTNVIGITTNSIEKARFDSSGNFDLGTTTAAATLTVQGTTTNNIASFASSSGVAYFTLAQNGSTTISQLGTGSVEAVSGLLSVIGQTGTGLNVLQTSPTLVTPVLGVASGTALSLSGNLYVTGNTLAASTTITGLLSVSATSTLATTTISGYLGVASTTPISAISVGTGAIIVSEYNMPTSTTMNISWASTTAQTSNQVLVKIGTSATTINFSGVTAGENKKVIVCNPPTGTAGAITWGTPIYWPSATIPTQTTTANNCDVWSFLATVGTSTASAVEVFGAQSAKF